MRRNYSNNPINASPHKMTFFWVFKKKKKKKTNIVCCEMWNGVGLKTFWCLEFLGTNDIALKLGMTVQDCHIWSKYQQIIKKNMNKNKMKISAAVYILGEFLGWRLPASWVEQILSKKNMRLWCIYLKSI